MTKRTLFLRSVMALVLFSLLLAGAGIDWSSGTGSDDRFACLEDFS